MTTLPLLCAAIAPLCADSGMNNKTDQQKQQMYAQEMNKITPIAEPAVSRAADPFVTADFIWWKAQEDGLDYAFSGVGTVLLDAAKGTVSQPGFKYEPGFKVGAGLKFRHDGWDLFAQYTYLRSNRGNNHGSSSSSSSSSSAATGVSSTQSDIFVPWATGSTDGMLQNFTVTSASANWKMNLNVLDIELGRNFWISKWLTLRPFTGMKFSFNSQKFGVSYSGPSNDTTNLGLLFLGDTVGLNMRINQFGVGLRSGLNTGWYFSKDWSIFGDFALTGLWNYFHSKRHDTITPPTVNIDNVKKHTSRVTAVFEWALGLRFETAWHNDDYMFMIEAGWEQQLWQDQNQFIFFPTGATGDQTFQGLTVKAGFYF